MPVVVKIPVPTILETTSAVALTTPSWRRRPYAERGGTETDMAYRRRADCGGTWRQFTSAAYHAPRSAFSDCGRDTPHAITERMDLWQSRTLSLLRIVAGFLFLCHGLQKFFGWFGGHRMPPTSLLGVAGIIETIGGVLIILGFCTRPVAFVLCGEMAVAFFRAHFPHGALPIQNGGELAVFFCFFYLYLVAAGPGSISVDAMRRGGGGSRRGGKR